MSDSVNQARTFEILTAESVRSRRRPRDWPDDEKTRIVSATLQPGANVSAIARSEGLDPSQLYGWRVRRLHLALSRHYRQAWKVQPDLHVLKRSVAIQLILLLPICWFGLVQPEVVLFF